MERKANITHLIAAFNALSSVQDRNFKCSTDFGQPFKITEDGRCVTVCNAAGWVVQHPYFRNLGLSLEKPIIGSTRYVPTFRSSAGRIRLLRGYGALAHVLEMELNKALTVFAPYYFSVPESVTIRDVLRRLKTLITKAGGKADLDVFLLKNKAPVAPVRRTRKSKILRVRVVQPFSAVPVENEALL